MWKLKAIHMKQRAETQKTCDSPHSQRFGRTLEDVCSIFNRDYFKEQYANVSATDRAIFLAFRSDWLAWLLHHIARWKCSWNLAPYGYPFSRSTLVSLGPPAAWFTLNMSAYAWPRMLGAAGCGRSLWGECVGKARQETMFPTQGRIGP